MFVTPAFAQAAAPGAGDIFSGLLPILLIIPIFYFLIIRPQQKRTKAHQRMLGSVARGDTIVTSGGLIGKVIRVRDDNELEVELAENVKVRVLRTMLSDVRSKPNPANQNDPGPAKPATRRSSAKKSGTTKSSGARSSGARSSGAKSSSAKPASSRPGSTRPPRSSSARSRPSKPKPDKSD
ncbi:MAG: preprotein translocase subunit YajC [Alphaproteobacteria bacterium]|nr:preprotein translocase subunit YajC [Alphaproteobacteria bacterium]